MSTVYYALFHRLAECCADVALLQEAKNPPSDLATELEIEGEPWLTPTDRGVAEFGKLQPRVP